MRHVQWYDFLFKVVQRYLGFWDLVIMQTSGLTTTNDNVVSEVALAQSALLTQHCSGRPQSPGVVNCFAYSRTTGLRVGYLALSDVSEVMAADPDIFVWIGLFEPPAEVLDEVQHEFGLHELAVEDAARGHHRAKIESYEDSLFVIVRTAQLVDREIVFGSTSLFLGERFLITVRQGASVSYTTVRAHCEKHPQKMKAMGPGYVMHGILDFIVDNFLPITQKLGKQLHELEGEIFSEQFNKGTLRYLYDLKSELIKLRLAVIPLREICGYFLYHDNEDLKNYFPSSAIPYFRDIQDHVLGTLDAIEGQSEVLRLAMDTHLALVGVGQNEIVKRLASWAGILAVPTLMTSYYGMNFSNMPELHWYYGYYIWVAIMVLASYLLYRKLKKVKWL
ncbi:magnesium and cobalt transport protein CorA [Aquirhabdus sp.]|uniref:magnesium and cobalt transport protein CorA n=1 Tax=Aquirhabdus sp. TaxID=2824160 RepID=UPI00396C7179